MVPNFKGLGAFLIIIGVLATALVMGSIWYFTSSSDEVKLQNKVEGVEPVRVEFQKAETSEGGHVTHTDTIYVYDAKDLK